MVRDAPCPDFRRKPVQHIAKHDRSDRQLPVGRRATGAARPRRPGEQERIFTTQVGLKIPTSLTYDRWEKAEQHIFQIADSSAWCLGDWLVYGQGPLRRPLPDRSAGRGTRLPDAAQLRVGGTPLRALASARNAELRPPRRGRLPAAGGGRHLARPGGAARLVTEPAPTAAAGEPQRKPTGRTRTGQPAPDQRPL